MRMFQVAVLGSSAENEEEMDVAFKAGYFIGKNGWILINGGRTGVMKASAMGFKKAIEDFYKKEKISKRPGVSIGILPGDDYSDANEYLDVVIPSGIGWARNVITALAGDIAIIIGGSSGTLSELTYTWNYGKRVITTAWLDGVSKEFAGKKLDYRRDYHIEYAMNLDELYKKLIDFYSKWIENFKC